MAEEKGLKVVTGKLRDMAEDGEETKASITIPVEVVAGCIGADGAALREKVGDDITNAFAHAHARVIMGNVTRGFMVDEDGARVPNDQVIEALKGWDPTIKIERKARVPVDPVTAAKRAYDKASPEEKEAILAQLTA